MVLNHSLPDNMEFLTPFNQVRTMLPTLCIKVHAGRRSANIRGIVAWASDFNLISERCRKRFNLPLIGGGVPSPHSLGGLANEILGRSRIKFSPHFDEDHSIILDVFVVERIDVLVTPGRLHPMVRANLSDFELADPLFDHPGEVDILLGVTFCPLLFKDGRYIIPGTSCYALETILGWIVMGRAPLEVYRREEGSLRCYSCTG